MLAKKLADEMKGNETSFNLNFKIEGRAAEKFDSLVKLSKKNRTELAKFIILNSLDDLIEQLNTLVVNNRTTDPSDLDEFEETIVSYTQPKIANLEIGKTFELKELVGDDWDKIGEHGDKNKAGKRFKKLIEAGYIENVRFVRTLPNHHALYEKV